MKYKLITFWLNKNDNSYYYKKVKGTYMKYEVGYINQYNHELIFVINVSDLIKNKEPLRNRVINKLICLLYKFQK